ncbi:MAG: DUF6569 family protein [Nakamurella sp.]
MAISLHVGRGEHRGPLTVFPLWRRDSDGPDVALAQAGDVRVGELDQPSVPHLQVTPTGGHPVLLLDGDLLVGGLQNRVAFGSRLLPPGRPTVIDVRCVEQERWHGSATHAVGGRASTFVRANPEQVEVWRRVDLERKRRQHAPDVRGPQPFPGQSGVMIGIGGRPVLIELFGTSAMLLAAWPRIIAAAAKEAAGRNDKPTAGWRARQFVSVIDTMRIARNADQHAVATETGIAATSGPYELRGIADGDRLLHASIINREAWSV